MEMFIKLALAGADRLGVLLLCVAACFAVLALLARLWHRRWWRDVRTGVVVVSVFAGLLIGACRVSLQLIEECSAGGEARLPSQLLDFRYEVNGSAAEGSLSLLRRLSQSGLSDEGLYQAFEREMLSSSRRCCSGVLDAQSPPAAALNRLPGEVREALESFSHAPDGGNLMSEGEKLFIHESLMGSCRARVLDYNAAYYRAEILACCPLCERLQGGVAVLAALVVSWLAFRDIRVIEPCVSLARRGKG